MNHELIRQLLVANEKVVHKPHQLEGVIQLVQDVDLGRTSTWNGVTYRREVPKCFNLFDEVGCGKTKQIIDASQILYGWNRLDTMLILAPGYARTTWADEDPLLGEVSLHAWDGIPNIIHEYHGNYTELDLSYPGLHWIVTNYEFIRRDERLDDLIRQLKGRTTWQVMDESWMIKGKSDQMKACAKLRRKRADRVSELNGTPLADGKPSDLYYPMAILDPSILGCKNKTHFRSKYCVTGGFAGKQVVGYQNLEEFNARIAPYILSRRTRDCFDLPDMLPPITIEARLSNETWKMYREMRDDLVTWLDGQVSVSKQAIVKILRLSQITSGFLGGLEEADLDEDLDMPVADDDVAIMPTSQPIPQWLRAANPTVNLPPVAFGGPFASGAVTAPVKPTGTVTREISREKLDAYMFWLTTAQRRPKKIVTWCRFRPELKRTAKELEQHYSKVLQLRGGQTKDERRAVKMLLAPGSKEPEGAVVGITGTGAASLNFSGAPIMVFLSHDPALIKRTQSIGRIERPGATEPLLIVDVVATGPKGQKTIDHHTLKGLRGKQDTATWTVQQWRDILKQE